jgi:activator of Hsp90 ATPase-like protein
VGDGAPGPHRDAAGQRSSTVRRDDIGFARQCPAADTDRALWDLWVDGARYPQWQGMLLAVRDVTGPVSTAGTTYLLDHGPKLKRQVRVLAAERPVRHVIEQTGMGVHDETTATFEPEGDGTRLTVVVVYRLGRLMSLLTRLDRKSRTERELQRELDRLAAVAARNPPPARVGGLYLAEAGGVRRRVTVLAVDPDRVHVRVHPGHLRERDPDDHVPAAPKPPSDQLELRPIDPPIRASIDAWLIGLPFLRRDGGHGVRHLALSLDAWADTLAREIGEEGVTAADREAVAAWRIREAPTVGVDADLELAPVCTLRLDASGAEGETWATAKVLRSEIMRIHLRIPADRWAERPASIPPEVWSTEPIPFEAVMGDLAAIWPVQIGHYPLSRAGFSAAKPRFGGVTTLEHEELIGYSTWRAGRGGTFDSLAWANLREDPSPDPARG